MTPLETLRTRTLTALADENAVAGASLTVEQRAAAGGQLVFKWTTSNNPEDERAPAGLRVQSLLILEQARLSGLVFDSVLLIASAVVFDSSERRTEVIAARAKYSKALVLRTDFTKVAPSAVFQLPDDKPAELDPRFK